MKAKRSDVRKRRAKVCQVTLEGESFDVTYDGNIPPALFVSLMEMSQLDDDFQAAVNQMGDLTGLSDEEKAARAKRAKDKLADARDRLTELATLLAKIVISQEYYDDDEKPIVPDYEYFSTCDLLDQMAYAAAIVEDKKRPTTAKVDSATTLAATSSAEEPKGETPSSTDVSEPPSGLPMVPPGDNSMTQIQ